MSTSFVIPAHAGIHGSPVVAGDDETSVIPASFVMPAKAGIHTALFARE